MVKSIISAILGFLILIGASIVEQTVVTKSFNEIKSCFTNLYEKTEKETATETDALTVQTKWLEKKKTLHVLIPHNEIKEVDLWLSESVNLIRQRSYKDALSKLEVAIELIEQIPNTFAFKIENIM